MSRYLLDTNMMGHFINRRKGVDRRARQARQRGAVLGTCLPVICELFFGVENSATRDSNHKRLVGPWPASFAGRSIERRRKNTAALRRT